MVLPDMTLLRGMTGAEVGPDVVRPERVLVLGAPEAVRPESVRPLLAAFRMGAAPEAVILEARLPRRPASQLDELPAMGSTARARRRTTQA